MFCMIIIIVTICAGLGFAILIGVTYNRYALDFAAKIMDKLNSSIKKKSA